MHRSGTSVLAGSLQQHGLYLHKVHEWNPFNKKGNRENAEIMALNDCVLSFNEAAWDHPPKSIKWAKEHIESRSRILEQFLQSGHRVWGFKDPRTLFTLKFWMEGLAGTTVKFAGSFRHPLPVARSLESRNKMPIEEGLILWEQYNSRLLDIQKKTGFPIVSFDVCFDEYQQSIKRVVSDLDIRYDSKVKELFLDDSLRHQFIDNAINLPHSMIELYNELTCIYREQSRSK
jgi:hypothetical protein